MQRTGDDFTASINVSVRGSKNSGGGDIEDRM
jgi:hypothetical protein